MADANAQAAKPAPVKSPAATNAAPASVPAAAVEDTRPSRRQVQHKRVPIGSFKPVGHFTEAHQVLIPADWDIDDVLKPDFFTFVAPGMQANPTMGSRQDRLGTVVEVITADHAFYALVYIKSLRRNSLGMADGANSVCIGPSIDPKTGKMCPVDLSTGGPWKGRSPVEDTKPADAKAA